MLASTPQMVEAVATKQVWKPHSQGEPENTVPAACQVLGKQTEGY